MMADDPETIITTFTVIPADCLALEEAFSYEMRLPRDVDGRTLRAILHPHISGCAERVRVFWEDQYTDMFIVDDGAIRGLPVNPVATMIYRNNVAVHDPIKLLGAASIHGPAVLFSRQVYF